MCIVGNWSDLQSWGTNVSVWLSSVRRFTGLNNTQKCVRESCENGGVGGMIETMMAPGYSSCNPAITECMTLQGASAWADCRGVTMRAMACESSVVLNPWPAVHHPDHRYVPSLLYSRDYNICCCQKKGKAASLFPCHSHSLCQPALCNTSGGLPELLQSLMYFCAAMS